MVNKMNKGQATIFVIVALFIVAAVIFVFLSVGKPRGSIGQEFEPAAFVSSCVRESVENKADIMIMQGGFVEPEDYIIYNDTKVSYICKNINYYEPCVMQQPIFITSLKNELSVNTEEDIAACLNLLEEEILSRGYEIEESSEFSHNVVLKSGNIEIKVNKNLNIRKDGATQAYNEFDIDVRNPLYDLGEVAQEISRQEAQYCHFSNDGFSLIYRDFDVKKDVMSDGTKIYSIRDKGTEKEMNIAVRGCVIPAGL